MKTAVEWLIDMLVTENEITLKGENYKLFDQAKAMEKEQIIDAFFEGKNDGILMETYSDYEHISPNEYYNETFKTN